MRQVAEEPAGLRPVVVRRQSNLVATKKKRFFILEPKNLVNGHSSSEAGYSDFFFYCNEKSPVP